MPWPLKIDPDEGRPKVLGSIWERIEKHGDAWDGPVEVAGVFEVSEANGGGLELCLRTVDFTGEPVMTADAEDFARTYRRVGADSDAPAEKLTARLATLEARS